MNKKIYNVVLICLLSSLGLIAQSQKTYQKTFPVNKRTKLKFETQNVDVTFKVWNKDEVKVDFKVDFKNYSDNEIKAISNGIIVAATMQSTMENSNYLHIRNASPTSIGRLSYQLKGDNHIYITNFGENTQAPDRYKSVSEINKEISTKSLGIKEMSGYIITKKDSIPLKDIATSEHKSIQSIRSTYEIYVPSYMMLHITAANANVNFVGAFSNPIEASFREGQLHASELLNKKNNINLMNGTVKIKKIVGGNYAFKNVTNGLIGQLEDMYMLTEFSKINIGEITKNVQFKDFKSNFFIYNLGENFETIAMLCEYSDIKMYTIKDQKYYMEAIGNNAVLNDNGTKIIMQPNRDGEKHKMFTRGKDDSDTRKNTFKIDLVHGFVTLYYTK